MHNPTVHELMDTHNHLYGATEALTPPFPGGGMGGMCGTPGFTDLFS